MANFSPPIATDVLVPYAVEHDQKTVAWLSSEDLQKAFGVRQTISLESHRRWVEAAHDTKIWAIVDKDKTHVGNVLLKINERHRSAYFQIYIGAPEARGIGLGEQAFMEAMRMAYEDYKLHRVWLHTFPENTRAESLYQKHGFVLEGVERDALYVEGRYITQRRWSLLASEWLAHRGKGM